MDTPLFVLTEGEIEDLEAHPHAAAYLTSWFLCVYDKPASDHFDQLLNIMWGRGFNFYTETRSNLRIRLLDQRPEPGDKLLAQTFVLAVFHAGFIAEAMHCKAALEQLGYWHD